MKTIVVYFSLNGNSEYVAQKIHKEIGADLLKLETEKAYTKNPASLFFIGGRSALMGEKPKLKPYQFVADDYEAVIFVTPLWAGIYAPAINTFLSEQKLKNKKVGFIISSKGGKVEKCFNKVQKVLSECKVIETLSLIDPAKNKKEEDIQSIKKFCRSFK